MPVKTINIFIASSSELEQDRKAFRELLSVENDSLHYKGAYLKLVQWEYFLDTVSDTSKQDDYNKELTACDIVICLFYTKAGKYTQQEFDTALKQFNEKGTPLIYTYFKEPDYSNNPAPVASNPTDLVAEQCRQDLVNFKKRLGELGHFFTRYKSIEDLKYLFLKQLDLLQEKGFIKLQEEMKTNTKDAVEKYMHTANVQGDNNTINQGGTVNQTTIHADNQHAEKIINLGSNVGNINF